MNEYILWAMLFIITFFSVRARDKLLDRIDELSLRMSRQEKILEDIEKKIQQAEKNIVLLENDNYRRSPEYEKNRPMYLGKEFNEFFDD